MKPDQACALTNVELRKPLEEARDALLFARTEACFQFVELVEEVIDLCWQGWAFDPGNSAQVFPHEGGNFPGVNRLPWQRGHGVVSAGKPNDIER